MPSKKTGYILGAIAGFGVTAAALAGAGLQIPEARAQAASERLAVTKASTAPIFAPPPGAPVSFADIFEQVSPAVVSINVTSRANANVLRIPGLPFNLVPRGQEPDGDGAQGSPGEGGDQGGQTAPAGQANLFSVGARSPSPNASTWALSRFWAKKKAPDGAFRGISCTLRRAY